MSNVLLSNDVKSYIKRYLCKDADELDLVVLSKACERAGLDIFSDVNIVKYKKRDGGFHRACIIVKKDAYFRIANEQSDFLGIRAGVIVEKKDKDSDLINFNSQ